MKVAGLLSNKCPECQKGKVYQRSNIATFGSNEMLDQCPVCSLNYSKNPGFYWGSMYASYGLALLESIVAYFICRLSGTGKYDLINLVIILASIIVCSPFNYRMARLIWLYLFPEND